MDFKFIKSINTVYYLSDLNYRENAIPIQVKGLVPGIQISGSKYHIVGSIDNNDFFKIDFLDNKCFEIYKIHVSEKRMNVKLIQYLAPFLGLEKYEGFSFYIKKGSFTSLDLSYFIFQDKQYLALHSFIDPEERTSESPMFYLECMWQVEFNHNKFISFF